MHYPVCQAPTARSGHTARLWSTRTNGRWVVAVGSALDALSGCPAAVVGPEEWSRSSFVGRWMGGAKVGSPPPPSTGGETAAVRQASDERVVLSAFRGRARPAYWPRCKADIESSVRTILLDKTTTPSAGNRCPSLVHFAAPKPSPPHLSEAPLAAASHPRILPGIEAKRHPLQAE